MDPYHGFSVSEIQRYSRHFSLAEVGAEGQAKLREARVLLVGAGGLGSPAALYLAAAGVGTLGIVDPDRVELSNLQRQVIHATSDVGRAKVASAGDRMRALNPEIRVEPHRTRLDSTNALEILEGYDLVVDGSDNFATRYLVNDACVLSGRPWVYGAVLRWEGQLALFAAPDGPCYRCLFAEPPPPGLVPGCAEAGVVGVLPGVIGAMQALEAIKWILGAGTSMAGRLLSFDALRFSSREIRIRRRPDCPICGESPSIEVLMDYDHFCATGEHRNFDVRMTENRGSEPDSASDGGRVAPEITPAEARRKLGQTTPPLLLDVREEWEWKVSNLASEGAIHVPFDRLREALADLPSDRDLVVYCRTGGRSAEAAQFLQDLGFNRVSNLAGGLARWVRELDDDIPVA
ncbi:MAG: molybdopterin-synthase adenylyltransferase MoeB [Gemmatimonadota bacterium]